MPVTEYISINSVEDGTVLACCGGLAMTPVLRTAPGRLLYGTV